MNLPRRLRQVENLKKVETEELQGLIVIDTKIVESINGSEIK